MGVGACPGLDFPSVNDRQSVIVDCSDAGTEEIDVARRVLVALMFHDNTISPSVRRAGAGTAAVSASRVIDAAVDMSTLPTSGTDKDSLKGCAVVSASAIKTSFDVVDVNAAVFGDLHVLTLADGVSEPKGTIFAYDLLDYLNRGA